MSLLSDHDVATALAALPGWKRSGPAIVRTFEFPDFLSAIAFVNRVAAAAEQADHHPDIAIHYKKVSLTLTSHDAGGLTKRDIRAAAHINTLVDTI